MIIYLIYWIVLIHVNCCNNTYVCIIHHRGEDDKTITVKSSHLDSIFLPVRSVVCDHLLVLLRGEVFLVHLKHGPCSPWEVAILAQKRGTMAPFLQTRIKSRARLISPWPSLVFTAKSSIIAWDFVDLSDAKNALVQKLTSVSFATELHVHRGPKSEILTLAHSCPLTNYWTNYILYCIDQRWLESLLMWACQHLNIR